MGDVVAVLKIMPENPEIDLDDLRSEVEAQVPGGFELEGFDEEDVAFGLTALNVTLSLDDDEGGAEPAREALGGLEGVESVQVTDVARV
jgi:elongation factor 1-beta